jgi:integrase
MADEVRRGADPVAEARARRASVIGSNGHTLAQLLDLYGRQVGSRTKSWRTQMDPHIRRVFNAHLGAPLESLSAGALQMTVDEHVRPKSATFGLRCLLPVLRWAAAPGRAYVDRSLLDVRASAPKPVRDRVLSREELGQLLPVLRVSDNIYAHALLLILLTAVRRGEIASARWRDIDFVACTWTLPTTKNGHWHIIPLSRQAIGLLRRLLPEEHDPDDFVFNANGKPLGDWGSATRRLQDASLTSGWTRHDLRRTAATLCGELGVMPDIIEALLNHTAIHSQIASVYNKSRYRPQVAVALQQLADLLDGIEAGGAEVVPLRER